MKNTFRYILALTLVLLSLPLLSACGKSENGEEKAGEGNVQFSNIVFPDMQMSPEEKKLLDSVQGLLSEAVLDCTDFYYEKLAIRNTLGVPLDIYFIVLHFDGDDKLVGSAWLDITEWRPDERLNALVSGSTDRYTPFDHASIAAEIVYQDHYLRTDYVPLKMRDHDVRLGLSMELPIQFTAKTGWNEKATFLLTELEFLDDHLQIRLKKLSGDASGYETIEYRILDRETSAIVGFGSFNMMNVEAGETIILRDGARILDLESGEYEVQFVAEDIREAA